MGKSPFLSAPASPVGRAGPRSIPGRPAPDSLGWNHVSQRLTDGYHAPQGRFHNERSRYEALAEKAETRNPADRLLRLRVSPKSSSTPARARSSSCATSPTSYRPASPTPVVLPPHQRGHQVAVNGLNVKHIVVLGPPRAAASVRSTTTASRCRRWISSANGCRQISPVADRLGDPPAIAPPTSSDWNWPWSKKCRNLLAVPSINAAWNATTQSAGTYFSVATGLLCVLDRPRRASSPRLEEDAATLARRIRVRQARPAARRSNVRRCQSVACWKTAPGRTTAHRRRACPSIARQPAGHRPKSRRAG